MTKIANACRIREIPDTGCVRCQTIVEVLTAYRS